MNIKTPLIFVTLAAVVTATEFGPIPGKQAMNIHLIGEGGDGEKFYYRIPMKGDEGKGYKVVGVFREQFAPAETRRPLPVKKSTGG